MNISLKNSTIYALLVMQGTFRLPKAWQVKLLMLFVMASLKVNAQNKSAVVAQGYINEAIKKAYPSSVRLWGFDTEKNERTSAQFSGVVVSENGLILTAAHTVMPGRTYKVFFTDGREVLAKALGRIDLAATPGIPDAGMLQVLDKGSFPFAEMAFSTSLKANDACLSISYPERLDQQLPTIRYGKIAEVKNEYGFIRSTCKMEPGDSGGALFDQMGRLIGIHSAIDVAEEMNFEIPIDVYRKYWTALHQEINYDKYPAQEDTYTIAQNAQKEQDIAKAITKLSNNLPRVQEAFLIYSKTDGEENKIAATLINYQSSNKIKQQFILSKSSMVGDFPNLLNNDVKIPLVIVKRDVLNDLILLKAPNVMKGGVDLYENDQDKHRLSEFVVTAQIDAKNQLSIIGNEQIRLPKVSSLPYFGTTVLFRSNPATINLVKTESPAALAGIKNGDTILSINQVSIKQASDFGIELAKYWPGEQITIELLRGRQKYVKVIKLTSKPFVPSKHPVDRFAGGVSTRRDGFDQVFTYDAVLQPSQAGAAIFNLKGEFLGINIGRFSRAVSLGMPKSLIISFLKSVGASN